MAEYKATFSHLEHFSQAFDLDERRAKRFVEGLQPGLRRNVMGYKCWTLRDAVDLAFCFEEDYKQFKDGQPKGKGKCWPYDHLFLECRALTVPGAQERKGRSVLAHLLVEGTVSPGRVVPKSVRLDLVVVRRGRGLVFFADRRDTW